MLGYADNTYHVFLGEKNTNYQCISSPLSRFGEFPQSHKVLNLAIQSQFSKLFNKTARIISCGLKLC